MFAHWLSTARDGPPGRPTSLAHRRRLQTTGAMRSSSLQRKPPATPVAPHQTHPMRLLQAYAGGVGRRRMQVRVDSVTEQRPEVRAPGHRLSCQAVPVLKAGKVDVVCECCRVSMAPIATCLCNKSVVPTRRCSCSSPSSAGQGHWRSRILTDWTSSPARHLYQRCAAG